MCTAYRGKTNTTNLLRVRALPTGAIIVGFLSRVKEAHLKRYCPPTFSAVFEVSSARAHARFTASAAAFAACTAISAAVAAALLLSDRLFSASSSSSFPCSSFLLAMYSSHSRTTFSFVTSNL